MKDYSSWKMGKGSTLHLLHDWDGKELSYSEGRLELNLYDDPEEHVEG